MAVWLRSFQRFCRPFGYLDLILSRVSHEWHAAEFESYCHVSPPSPVPLGSMVDGLKP